MNVLYTCDNNYIWLMGISTISLFENNKHIFELTVYLLGDSISNENKNLLSEIEKKYNRSIIVIDVPKIEIPESLVTSRWPLSAFTRLYSGQLLPQNLDRILYLDCDTIIKGDIIELENYDISKNVVCGVKDCIGKLYKKNIGLAENDLYVNAGVLLFNLTELRKININKTIEQYMKNYEKLINYADQDILNGVFKNKIGVLDPKYDLMTIDVAHSYKEIVTLRKPTNFYSESELEQAVAAPHIIHYTTNMRVVRPWFKNTNHPLAAEFVSCFLISPWAEQLLHIMKFTTRESKIIGIIMRFPKSIAYKLLGFIHSTCKPLYIKIRSLIGG